MKIWTGNICRCLPMVGAVGLLTLMMACSSSSSKNDGPKAARSDEVDNEVSLKTDRDAVEELRKDIPEEIRRSNDKLAETLNRWKVLKMAPEDLREHFEDEIRKMRNDMDKHQHRKRDDFQRALSDQRKEFQNKQKDERDDFFATKPKSDKRQAYIDRQSEKRERFTDDQRDARNDFEEAMKDERKEFEADIAGRWLEFRQEYPEYSRLYKEMKDSEEKRKEEEKDNPKPYSGWPYKMPGDESASGSNANPNAKAPDPASLDVNKGRDGWPSTDSSEFDRMGN